MYSLIVKGKFDAAHHLPGYPGDCARTHGHTWLVEVKVSGETLQPNMFLVDFKEIKDIWKKYDHQNLNEFFEFPTAENISQTIWKELHSIPFIDVGYVEVWESPDASVRYSE